MLLGCWPFMVFFHADPLKHNPGLDKVKKKKKRAQGSFRSQQIITEV